jgi:hypothetical protein
MSLPRRHSRPPALKASPRSHIRLALPLLAAAAVAACADAPTASLEKASPGATVQATPPCTGCEYHTGSLARAGDVKIIPGGAYYTTTTSGTHKGWGGGPARTHKTEKNKRWNTTPTKKGKV